MINQLKVQKQHSIVILRDQGWFYRKIARELGIDRATVKRYLSEEDSKPAISPIGSKEGESVSNAAIVPHGSSSIIAAGRRSECEPWREVIVEALKLGLSAQRIYQDLVSDHSFSHSYDSVKRFVRRLDQSAQLPMVLR